MDYTEWVEKSSWAERRYKEMRDTYGFHPRFIYAFPADVAKDASLSDVFYQETLAFCQSNCQGPFYVSFERKGVFLLEDDDAFLVYLMTGNDVEPEMW